VGFAGNSEQRREWLGWASHLEADRVGNASATNQSAYEEMTAAGAVTPEKWAAALGVTSPERLAEDAAALHSCLREAKEIERLTAERTGSEGANLQGLTTLLGDIADYVEARLPGAGTSAESEASAATAASGRASASTAPRGGAIGSRAEALARLSDVARYFRDTEPHSPVSRLVERAVRWGNMSFEELLRDVVKSDSALQEIWETLGVKPPGSNE
jgi:type VI secretion system protein ImpA